MDTDEERWMEVGLPDGKHDPERIRHLVLAMERMDDEDTSTSAKMTWQESFHVASRGGREGTDRCGTGGGGARGLDGGVITWQLLDHHTLEVVVGHGQRRNHTLHLQLPTESVFPTIDGCVRSDTSAKVAALGADEKLYILHVPRIDTTNAKSNAYRHEWIQEDVQVRDLSTFLGKVGTVTTLCVGETFVAIGGTGDAVLLVPEVEDQEPKVLKEPAMQKIWKGLSMRSQAGHVVRLVSCSSGLGNYLAMIRSNGTVCLCSTDTYRWEYSVNVDPSAGTRNNAVTEVCLEEKWEASSEQPHCLVHLCAAFGQTIWCYQIAMSWKNTTLAEVSVCRFWHCRAPGDVNQLKIAGGKVWALTSGDTDDSSPIPDGNLLWWAPLVDYEEDEIQLMPVLPFDWEVDSVMRSASEDAESNAWKRIFESYTPQKSRKAFIEALLSDGVYCKRSMAAILSFLGQSNNREEQSFPSLEGCRVKLLEGLNRWLAHNPETREVALWHQILQEYRSVWKSLHAPRGIFCTADGSEVLVHRGECITVFVVGDPVEFHAAGFATTCEGPLAAMSEIGNHAANLTGSTGLWLLEASALEPDFCTAYLPRLVAAGIGRSSEYSFAHSNEVVREKNSLERFRAQKVVASILKGFRGLQMTEALVSEVLFALKQGCHLEHLESEPMEETTKGGFLSFAVSARFRRLVSLRLRYVSKMIVALECISTSTMLSTEHVDILYEELSLLLRHFSVLRWFSSTLVEESNLRPRWMLLNQASPAAVDALQIDASLCQGMSLFELTATVGSYATFNFSSGNFVTQSAVLAMRGTFAALPTEHGVPLQQSDTWPEEMLAGVALGLCQCHQLDALSKMLTIFEGAVHELSSPILAFVRALWHCAMMQKSSVKQEQENHLKRALSSFSRAIPVLHSQQSNFRLLITNIVQALTRNEAYTDSNGLPLKSLYSEGLMLFFERLGCPQGAEHFGTLYARLLSEEDTDRESQRRASSKVWNNNFSYALQLGNFEEAYSMMSLVNDPTSALECLRHLVLGLCSGKDCTLLQLLPFAGVVLKALPGGKSAKTCIAKETVKTLLGHAELSSLKSHPHPYYILSSFLQQRNLFGTSWMVLAANARRAKSEWKPSMGVNELENTISSFSMAKCTLQANNEEVISLVRQTRGQLTREDRSKRRRLSVETILPSQLSSKLLDSQPWEHCIRVDFALTTALLSLTKLGTAPPASTGDTAAYGFRMLPILLSKRLYKEALVLCAAGIPVEEQAQVLEEIFSSIAHDLKPHDILLQEDLTSSFTHEHSSTDWAVDASAAAGEGQSRRTFPAANPILQRAKETEHYSWLNACRKGSFLIGVLLSERPDMPVSHWLSWALKGGSLPAQEFALLLHFHLRHRMHTEAAEWALDYLQSHRGDHPVQWSPYGLLQMLLSGLEAESMHGSTTKAHVLFPLLASQLSNCIEKSKVKG